MGVKSHKLAYNSKIITDRENLKDLRLSRIKSSTKVSIGSKLSDEYLYELLPFNSEKLHFLMFSVYKITTVTDREKLLLNEMFSLLSSASLQSFVVIGPLMQEL